MEVRARSKDNGISPRKVRLYIDMVRGRRVNEALNILNFSTSPIARVVANTVKSAAANAENNFHMELQELKIVKIYADEAKTQKRWRARSRGRPSPILKRSSHVTVVVSVVEA